MKTILLRLGQVYVSLAVIQFVIGVCIGIWLVSTGQQPLDWFGQ